MAVSTVAVGGAPFLAFARPAPFSAVGEVCIGSSSAAQTSASFCIADFSDSPKLVSPAMRASLALLPARAGEAVVFAATRFGTVVIYSVRVF
jgi:hypothetical protein